MNENADGDIYDVIQSFMEWITADCICAQCRALKPHEMEKRHQMKLVGHNVQFDLRHLNGAIDHCQSKKGNKRWEKVDIQKTDPLIYNLDGNDAFVSIAMISVSVMLHVFVWI